MNIRMAFLRQRDDTALNSTSIADTAVVDSYRKIKLLILLSFQVLSILCSVFVFINIILRPSKIIKPIRNHFALVLLVVSFVQVTTELSMVERYLDTGVIEPSTNIYCLFFNWYEFSLNGISLFVMFWASIERHIMIFSQSVFQIRWKRIVFHYIPLTLAILYRPTFYTYAIFIYGCTNNWNYHELLCAAPCFYRNKIFAIIEWLMNIIIPAFSIALANLLLIIRVVYRSTRTTHNIQRTKRNRKMTIQLLTIASIFLLFWLPIATTGLIQQFFDPASITRIQFDVLFYLIYFIQLFVPFVCLVSLPELQKIIIIRIRQLKHRNVVGNATTEHFVTVPRPL